MLQVFKHLHVLCFFSFISLFLFKHLTIVKYMILIKNRKYKKVEKIIDSPNTQTPSIISLSVCIFPSSYFWGEEMPGAVKAPTVRSREWQPPDRSQSLHNLTFTGQVAVSCRVKGECRYPAVGAGYTEQEHQGVGSALKSHLGGCKPQRLPCAKHIFP